MSVSDETVTKPSTGPIGIQIVPEGVALPPILPAATTTTTTSNTNTMMRRKRRQTPLFALAIGILAVGVIFFLSWEQQHEATTHSYPEGRSEKDANSGLKLGMELKNRKQALKTNPFDVNAPPKAENQQGATAVFVGNDDDDYDRKSFIFWGQQANRLVEPSNSYDQQDLLKRKKKKKKKKKKLRPFPVIRADDDRVPKGITGSIVVW